MEISPYIRLNQFLKFRLKGINIQKAHKMEMEALSAPTKNNNNKNHTHRRRGEKFHHVVLGLVCLSALFSVMFSMYAYGPVKDTFKMNEGQQGRTNYDTTKYNLYFETDEADEKVGSNNKMVNEGESNASTNENENRNEIEIEIDSESKSQIENTNEIKSHTDNEDQPQNDTQNNQNENEGESENPSNPFDYFALHTPETPAHQRNNFATPDDSIDLTPYLEYNYPADPSREDDKDCIFLNSSIYRSVYVYPTWKNETDGWYGPILNSNNKNLTEWPWIDIDKRGREGKWGHYGEARNQMGQYTLELIVRDIMTHPDSCLRTMDPTKASLFYVPYLPSTEFHNGKTYAQDYSTSPYAKAVESAIEGKYYDWEHYFGLTSDFWKRRNGADHILVFSEPLHGLSHPRSKRGSHHFIYTQKMLTPPIILSIEVSTSFVNKYPKCSSKNIVAPYPNTDGFWLNGEYDNQSFQLWEGLLKHNATLPSEKDALPAVGDRSDIFVARPVAQYYSAGNHGTCKIMRVNMGSAYKCTPSSRAVEENGKMPYHYGMRVSTFCPCTGGDSPSAKRMFDAVNAGCIPVILSYDYVWPFTTEADVAIPIDPSSFSLRWNSSDFWESKLGDDCKVIDLDGKPSFQSAIENVDASEIAHLREGMREASRSLYSYWSSENYTGTDHPLREGILPNGGAAKALVKLLGERAGGSRWEECKVELEGRVEGNDETSFLC